MRLVLATLVFAAACGSKSPAPAQPSEEEATESTEPTGATAENGNPVGIPEEGFVSEECDQYCADGCPEVEDDDACLEDCGCSHEGEDE